MISHLSRTSVLVERGLRLTRNARRFQRHHRSPPPPGKPLKRRGRVMGSKYLCSLICIRQSLLARHRKNLASNSRKRTPHKNSFGQRRRSPRRRSPHRSSRMDGDGRGEDPKKQTPGIRPKYSLVEVKPVTSL